MNAWVWRGLVVILSLGLVGTSQPLKAAPLDVCQAMASADWATATNWSCGHAPTSIDAAMLPAGVTLAVNTDSEVGDLTLATGGTRISFNNGALLNIHGTLATTATATSSLITGNGRVRMVGGARQLFAPSWSAGTPGLRLEVALDSGAVGISAQGVKGGEILISSGAFSTTNDVRPDNGASNTGNLLIAAGAALITAGEIERTGAAGEQAASIIVSGTLETSGARLSANNITIATGGLLRVKRAAGLTIAGAINYSAGSTLEYAGNAAQTTGGELTTTAAALRVANAAGVTLNKSTTVNGELALISGALTTGAYTLTLGDLATCTGGYEVIGNVQRLGPTLATTACFGHPHTSLTFTSGAPPSSAAIKLSSGTPPFAGAVARQYTVSAPGFTGAATLRLHYLDSELNGATEANLHLWRFDGSRWRLMGRSAIDAANNYVELADVTAFSDWAIAEKGEPTAVTVVDFHAETHVDGIHLLWETADETLNAGFHVLRSESHAVHGARITTELIPSQTAGSVGGAVYHYIDATPSTAAKRFYWLEDVELTGATARHGPVVVQQTLVWLPLVTAAASE
ncbi:hypothetical protein [Caldilinea sp.]|uniref:hypothetical protein n=1 Tax=Caldilinea sp. TaxID=2293560 RepID=UPI002CE13630|nr:hypothetical protein [Caldilinea sp.]